MDKTLLKKKMGEELLITQEKIETLFLEKKYLTTLQQYNGTQNRRWTPSQGKG